MNTAKLHPGFQHFSQLPLSLRFLYSGALCVLGMGYLFALIHLFFTYAGKDGDPSSVSYEDMVIAYSGTGKDSRLESALRGSMSAMLPKEEVGKITPSLGRGSLGWPPRYAAFLKNPFESPCAATLSSCSVFGWGGCRSLHR